MALSFLSTSISHSLGYMVDVGQTIDKELAIPTASSKQSTRSGTSSSSSEELDEEETVQASTSSMMPWAGCVEPVGE